MFWGALAYVLIGGVGVGILLTLLFLTALYALWFRVAPAPKGAEAMATAQPPKRGGHDARSSGAVSAGAREAATGRPG